MPLRSMRGEERRGCVFNLAAQLVKKVDGRASSTAI
jgi:hypothetical protein